MKSASGRREADESRGSSRRSARRGQEEEDLDRGRGRGRGKPKDDKKKMMIIGGAIASLLLIIIIVAVAMSGGEAGAATGGSADLNVEAGTLLGRMQQAVERRDLDYLHRVYAEYQRYIQAVQDDKIPKTMDYQQIQTWSRRVRDTTSELSNH